MEFQSFNSELAIASLLFKRLFSNIRIGRTNAQGEEKQVLVQCMFSQRSRILKNLENPERRGNMKLPLIAIQRTGYSRNGERLNNLNNEVKYEITSHYRKYHLMAPIPVDITYDVTVIAKYPADIDKIASNFMVFFNSDIYVSCEHPKYQGIKMNNQVIMSDSVSEEHPDEFDGTQDDITTATFQFTFKTYLFGGTQKAKLVPQKIVQTKLSSFISAYPVEIPHDKIDDFQKKHPTQAVSALLTSNVTAEVSSWVDNPETSSTTYDDVPVINNIDFGFYVVPNGKDIKSYIQSVDNGDFGEHEHANRIGYISSESYLSAPLAVENDPYVNMPSYKHPLSASQYSVADKPLSTVNDFYDVVDDKCSLEPYVDKLYWRIDGLSPYQPPNNLTTVRG